MSIKLSTHAFWALVHGMQTTMAATGSVMKAIARFQVQLNALDKAQLLRVMELVEKSPLERTGMIVEKVLSEDE